MTEPVDDRVAILVHEVRSPVAALAAVAEALADVEDAGSRRELVGLALGACAAIERIVTDIAVASVRLTPVDVAAIVHDVVAARAVSGVTVVSEVAAGLPTIEGDPVRLRQALDNLVTNGLLHGGGSVVVAATESAEGVAVTVADEGRGIPPDELGRIFEPGVRLHEGRPGFGLGLALTKAIVEAHGGMLTVDSTPGEGTTFTIVLPPDHPDT
jgi:signal transduction histidine kinase